jgi:competence protein ComEC
VILFSRLFGRWRGALAALVSIAIYAILVGAGAGVIRAAIMSGVSLGAQQFGRRQHGLTSLGFTAALMALFEPAVLWNVSFQLSFTATLGLILYAEPLGQLFIRFLSDNLPLTTASLAKKLSGPVGEYFLFTLAAQVTTLPVTIYHFQRLSASSLIANPLILPAQPPVMGLGGLAVLLGSFYLPLGQAVATLCWPFLAYTTRMVEWLAGLRLGNIILGQSSLFSVLLFYALLLAQSGYTPLNPPEWIARWQPQVILLSVEAGDEEGRPDVETLAAIEGYTVLRTDRNGWIRLSTDGERLWVEVERR